jgi:hypothetical protein
MDNTRLLQDAINEFDYVVKNIASHSNVLDNRIYPQPSTYLTTHYICMKVAGFDIDYDILTTISRTSALFAYKPDDFMPKYAHLHINIDKRIEQATGFGFEWLAPTTADECYSMIKDSIDNNKLVKSTMYENVLFIGYSDHEIINKRKIYLLSDGADYYSEWGSWNAFLSWFKEWGHTKVGRFTKRTDPLNKKDIAIKVINDLVNWSTQPPQEVLDQYPEAKFGLEGINEYANDCENLKKYKNWKACHDINPQWITRNSTAVYLKNLADENIFNQDTNVHINKSSEFYKEAYLQWRIFNNYLGYVASKKAGRNKGNRTNGANAIRQALEYEKQAINELRTAIKLMIN